MSLQLKTILICILITQSISSKANSDIQCRVTQPNWASQFNRVYQKDEFFIFYSDLDNSEHRLKQTADRNQNKIPDYIEDIATQAIASRKIFSLAGFRHPLKSPRYQKKARAISIFVKNFKGNGVAFEVPSQYPNLNIKTPMPCSLIIHVSNALTDFPANYWTTVTHEFFHLYQYAYTQFKNSWYLESLANWSERALRVDLTASTKRLGALPQSSESLKKDIFKQAYNPLWRRLSVIEPQNRLVIPNHLKLLKYTDGSLVFKDQEWRGTKLALNVMQNLEIASNQISTEKKWPAYDWKEDDQRLEQWNLIIWKNIQAAMHQQNYKNPELNAIKNISINQ